MTPGERVGPYTLQAKLGQGGQGQVWGAVDAEGQRFALKLMVNRTPDQALRALREARLQGSLSVEQVVTVHDVFDHDKLTVIVSDWIDGASMQDWIRNQQSSLDDIAAIADGVFAAVEAIHSRGLMHRDLKPSNILLRREGRRIEVKLTDFGIAREQDQWQRGQTLTQARSVLGTPGYIPPEQFLENRSVDQRSDLFALGAVFYELVTGRKAFAGPTPSQVFIKASRGDFTSPSAFRPEMPDIWEQAIRWALQPDKANRVATAEQFRQAWNGLVTPPEYATRDRTEQERDRDWEELLEEPSRGSTQTGIRGKTFGRKLETRRLRQLIEKERLVVVRGPAGIGKTHLARHIFERYPTAPPARYVDLIEASQETALLAALAHGLALGPSSDDLRDIVIAALRVGGGGVVVLDNAERCSDVLANLLAEAREGGTVRPILVTSRVRPRIPGEVIYDLGALDLSSSIRLYTSHALHGKADRKGEAHKADLEELVRVLEGNPLALTLAAARSQSLSLDAMVSSIRERTGSSQGGSDAMSVALEWSWGMLQPIEQAVLAQCGVFRAPFNLDDAEAVVDLSPWSDSPDLATILDVLVENSLIKLTGELEDGRRHRLTLYRNVRVFVSVKMRRRGSLGLMVPAEAVGEAAFKALHLRHAEWFARLGDAGLSDWRRTDAGFHANGDLEEHQDNIFAALETALEYERSDLVVPLTVALRDAVRQTGKALDAAALMGQVLTVTLKPAQQVIVFDCYVQMLLETGRVDTARRQAERLEQLASRVGDQGAAAMASVRLATMDFMRGDFESARRRAQSALPLLEMQPHSQRMQAALRVVGTSEQYLGNLALAREVFQRAHDLSKKHGLVFDIPMAHLHLGSVAAALGDLEAQESHYEAAREGAQRIGQRKLVARMHTNLALLYGRTGRARKAVAYLQRAIRLARELEQPGTEGIARGNLGIQYMRLGEFGEARAELERAVRLCKGNWRLAEWAFRGSLARLDARTAMPERALRSVDALLEAFTPKRVDLLLAMWAVKAEVLEALGQHDARNRLVVELIDACLEHGPSALVDHWILDCSPQIQEELQDALESTDLISHRGLP